MICRHILAIASYSHFLSHFVFYIFSLNLLIYKIKITYKLIFITCKLSLLILGSSRPIYRPRFHRELDNSQFFSCLLPNAIYRRATAYLLLLLTMICRHTLAIASPSLSFCLLFYLL